MQPSRDIDTLLAIMAALRDKASGCPWDVEQTFESIAPYTLEEAYEVVDAIRRGDRVDLKDELGDLLLQVVYYAQMAAEESSFTFADVVEAITTKLIRRHPHVFGRDGAPPDRAGNPGAVKSIWDAIKGEEKAARTAARRAAGLPEEPGTGTSVLAGVKTALPAFQRALKLQEKAAKVGFDWPDAAPVLDKIIEEAEEVRAALAQGQKAEITGEIGDLLFAVVNLARHAGVEPEAALQKTNDKFTKRFGAVEAALSVQGRSLEDATLEEMESLWQAAKGKI
jgi:nucleoside triphosphate diphosphatase